MIFVNGIELTLIHHSPEHHFYHVALPQNMSEAELHAAFLNQRINGEVISDIGCFFHRNTHAGFWVHKKQSFISQLFKKIKRH